jgi:ParB-like chromosome segregation protein Spo0J
LGEAGGRVTAAVRFQALPPLSPDEYKSLEESVLAHGILVPILVDEFDVVIDGHHRQRIAQQHDLPCPREVKTGFTDVEKRTLALSLNIDRRHLTRVQRHALVAESIKTDPHLSDREHGRRTGVDHKTAGTVRDELEQRGEIPHVPERVDSVGRHQPASKPSQPEPSKPRRRPLTDTARELGLELGKINKRLNKLADDDRFDRNREQIGCMIRPEVGFVLKTLDRIDAEINNREPSAADILRAIAKMISESAGFVSQIDSAEIETPECVQHIATIRDGLDAIHDCIEQWGVAS